nr:M55 family metallopeptidase [Azospirillum thermophilum]
MRIYVSADIEGVAGVVSPSRSRRATENTSAPAA